MSTKQDINNNIKLPPNVRNDRFVIFGVPLQTTEIDILCLLTSWFPNKSYSRIHFHTPKQPKTVGGRITQAVFIDVENTEDLVEIINSFDCLYNANGYQFTNKRGKRSRVRLSYANDNIQDHSRKNISSSENSTSANRESWDTESESSVIRNEKGISNVRNSSIKDNPSANDAGPVNSVSGNLKHENKIQLSEENRNMLFQLSEDKIEFEKDKKDLLKLVADYEKDLKARSPILFTSEYELTMLSTEEGKLMQKHEQLLEDVELAKNDLENIKIQFEELRK